MIVGGNIDHLTRVMTTAIALETSKGELALALGAGADFIAFGAVSKWRSTTVEIRSICSALWRLR